MWDSWWEGDSVSKYCHSLRIKAKSFNISLICDHAATEEKDVVTKDVKIVLRDFKARVSKEAIFGTTIGKFRLHDEAFKNGLNLINFAGAQKKLQSQQTANHLLPDLHS